jgi:hypothetical protein
LKGLSGLRPNSGPTLASFLQVSAPVQEAPPVGYVQYDEVSCLTCPSSSIESNEESNHSNDENISSGQTKGTTQDAKSKYSKDYIKQQQWLHQNIFRS